MGNHKKSPSTPPSLTPVVSWHQYVLMFIDERMEPPLKVSLLFICIGNFSSIVKGDPDGGIKPGTPFEENLDNGVCPVCGATCSENTET
ncbi:MAG: hypothetical protein A3J94_11660 [Syntrophus sp. RIFOXYC2_FULL_54_9]|nr:MAG: hypothetical protein A3J94_11660 [Syntrophus sp. RIFOXYC2_FULL_54_9]